MARRYAPSNTLPAGMPNASHRFLRQHHCRLFFELLVGSLEIERFSLKQVGCIHSAGDGSPQFHFPLRRRGQFDQHFHLMHDRR